MTPPPPPMPIFVRTFDFLTWLLPATNNFPRAHRHTVTQRLLNAAFDLRERLEEANLRQGAARLDEVAALEGDGGRPRHAGEGRELRERCLLYTSPSPRDRTRYRMPSSA